MGRHHHVADAVDLAVQLVILAIQEPLDNRFGALGTNELPLTLRSLIIVTLSPSANRVPWASLPSRSLLPQPQKGSIRERIQGR